MATKMVPSGQNEILEKLPTFAEAQDIIGGMIEVINLRNGNRMLVNEDGYSMGLEGNMGATEIYGGLIVGTVIYGTPAEINKICSK